MNKTSASNNAVFQSDQLFRIYCRKMDITDEKRVNSLWKEIWKQYKNEEDVVKYLYSITYNTDIPVPSADVDYDAAGDVNKYVIRNLVDSYYDIQKLRISTGNRICTSFKTQLGQKPGKSEDTMEKEAAKTLHDLRKEYDRITDGMADKQTSLKKTIEALSKDPKPLIYIRSKTDYELVESYIQLQDSESKVAASVQQAVQEHPMWNAFFSKVKGCGPMMAGVCLAYFDINKARYATSFIAYAGIDAVSVVKVDKDGLPYTASEGHGLKHTREEIYKKADDTWGVKNSIGYNPKLKSTLLSTLADGFLKAGYRREKDGSGAAVEGGWIQAEGYARAYAEYIHRLDNRVDTKNYSRGHKHLMGKRYMIKLFLKDMWTVWRQMAGYDIGLPYEVEFLGKDPHHYNRYYTMSKKVYSNVDDYEGTE